jgi:hypothetical protein
VKHKLTRREVVQICAALRLFGRCRETGNFEPSHSPILRDRFKHELPLSNDELETLIGHLDGSWTGRGLRRWDALRYL